MLTALIGSQKKLIREGRRYGRSILRRSLERTAKTLGSQAMALGTGAVEVSEDDGYVRFPAAGLIGEAAFRQIADMCKSWPKDSSRVNVQKKDFLINLMRAEDLLANPNILKLVLHDEIISGVSRYLGQVPRLFNLYMWWSPPNQSLKGSQLYHYDHRDTRQIKVFINLNDISEASGPLHFVRASDCLKVDAGVGYSQDRYTDEEVYSCVAETNVVQAVGPAGTAYAVDTARCLHYGSRGNTLDRLVFMVSFARANSVEPGGGCETLDPIRSRLTEEIYRNDPVRSFILSAPK